MTLMFIDNLTSSEPIEIHLMKYEDFCQRKWEIETSHYRETWKLWDICYFNRWLRYSFIDSLFLTGKGENIIKNCRILIFWKRKKSEVIASLMAAAAIDKNSKKFNYDSIHHSNPLQFSRIWDNRTLLYQNNQKIDLCKLIFDHWLDNTTSICLSDIIFDWFGIRNDHFYCKIPFKNASKNFGNISYSRDYMVRLNFSVYREFLRFDPGSASLSLWTTLRHSRFRLWCPKIDLEWVFLVDFGTFFCLASD